MILELWPPCMLSLESPLPAGECNNCLSLYTYYYTIEDEATDHVIAEEGVAALEFLISGSADKKSVCSVLSLVTMPSS